MSVVRLTTANAGKVSAALYTGVSLLAAALFFLITVSTGDYSWVARIGGAIWIFGLSMIITMPTVTPWLRGRATELTKNARTDEKEDVMVKDLVCGMTIDPATAAGTSEYKGKTYYFCAALSCKKAFDEDPEKYIAA